MKSRRDVVTGQHVANDKVKIVRRLRSQMTDEEKRLWQHLRGNRLDGVHFRRQQIIDGFIVDFYCHSVGLVIEVDGEVHENQVAYDADRDAILKARGLKILRISNDAIRTNPDGVLELIRSSIKYR